MSRGFFNKEQRMGLGISTKQGKALETSIAKSSWAYRPSAALSGAFWRR
jgi:hypothetical protein